MGRRSSQQHKASRYKPPGWRDCAGKKRYSRAEAQAASERRQALGAPEWTAHPYRCGDHWHIGHTPGGSWSR